jgi:precorrin-3B methylase
LSTFTVQMYTKQRKAQQEQLRALIGILSTFTVQMYTQQREAQQEQLRAIICILSQRRDPKAL